VPLVVTIHDLAVLRYPETFNRWTGAYSLLLLPRLARAATRVIAVSEFTAREAVELLGVDERRIRVILEAMASGTPVVTATGSGPDLAAGAAVLVDPLDTDAIAAGIREALARREELRAAGLARAEAFTWAAAAAKTAAVYREAADG
jgi:glycosyltransferase involved in cell wall biosynthesis